MMNYNDIYCIENNINYTVFTYGSPHYSEATVVAIIYHCHINTRVPEERIYYDTLYIKVSPEYCKTAAHDVRNFVRRIKRSIHRSGKYSINNIHNIMITYLDGKHEGKEFGVLQAQEIC